MKSSLSIALASAALCAACQTVPSGADPRSPGTPSVSNDSAIAIVRIASFPESLRGSTLVFRIEPRKPGAPVAGSGGIREFSVPIQTLSPRLIEAPAGEFVFHSIVHRGTPVPIDPPMKATLPAGAVVYVGDLNLQIQTVSAPTVIPGADGGGTPGSFGGGFVRRDIRVGYGVQVRPETVEQARPQLPEAARSLEVLVHPLAVPQQSR